MGYYYLKCRSVTYAQRAADLLRGKGIYSSIVKLPLRFSSEGCGYSLKISERQFIKAYDMLKNADYDITVIFYSKDGKSFDEVVL